MSKAFPIQAVNDDDYYFRRESGLFHQIGGSNIYTDTAIARGAVDGAVYSMYVPAGRILRLQSIGFSANKSVNSDGYVIKGSYGSNSTGSSRIQFRFSTGDYGGSGEKQFGGIYLYEDGQITFSVAANNLLRSSWNLVPVGELLTYDLTFNARFTYLALGDSITEGHTMGSIYGTSTHYLGKWNFTNYIRDQLINAGCDIRVWNDGRGGTASDDVPFAVDSGRYSHVAPNIMTFGYGMNDAASGTMTPTLFKENIAYGLNYFFQKNPKCSFVLLGASSTNDPTRTTNIASYRTAMQALATTEKPNADMNIYYHDCSSDFAVGENNQLYFRDTEVANTPNALVHPSGAGSTKIGQGIYTLVQTTNFYQNNVGA